MVAELRKGDLIVELPPTSGTTRRYVISNKGRAELEKLKGTVQKEARKQLEVPSHTTASSPATGGCLRRYGIRGEGVTLFGRPCTRAAAETS